MLNLKKNLLLFISYFIQISCADSQILGNLANSLSSLVETSHQLKFSYLNIEKQIEKTFPDKLVDSDQTAKELNYFIELIKFNNISLDDPMLKVYVDKVAQSPEKYNLLYRAVNLNLEALAIFLIQQVKLKFIDTELLPGYQQALNQKSVRAFLAADIPIDFSNIKKFISNKLGSSVFKPEKQQHLTILFLGDVQLNSLEIVTKIIKFIITVLVEDRKIRNLHKLSGFYLTIHPGIFGIKRKLMVLDLQDINSSQPGLNFLTKLHDELLKHLLPNVPQLSTLPFLGHITLGTLKAPPSNQLLEFIKTIRPPIGARGLSQSPAETFDIKTIILYGSVSGNYTPLARWSLA